MTESRQVPENEDVQPSLNDIERNEDAKPDIKTGIKSGPEFDVGT